MGLQPDSVYGFAKHDDVDAAIAKRLADLDITDVAAVSALLGEAIAALSDINQSIPVQSRQRHLVAGALENFANGS